MISKLKNSGFLFYLVCILDFYVFPLFCHNMGSEIIVFMVIMPMVCFITSLIYGFKMGVDIRYILTVSILFVPHLFSSKQNIWIFFLLIGAITYMGMLLGNEIGNVLEVGEEK